jgi:hypothetical protein
VSGSVFGEQVTTTPGGKLVFHVGTVTEARLAEWKPLST